MLGIRFCARAFCSCGEQGPLFIAVRGPLTVAEHRLQTRSSVVVAHRPSCSAACGIFPDQGSNPCPLHWQADSQPLRHQGSPQGCLYSPRPCSESAPSATRTGGCVSHTCCPRAGSSRKMATGPEEDLTKLGRGRQGKGKVAGVLWRGGQDLFLL